MGTYVTTTTSIEPMMIGISFDTATTSLVSKMITHSENEVNKWCARRYDISLWNTTTSIPPLAISLTEQLAEGYTWQRLSRGNKEWRDHGATLIKQALANLKEIADGNLDMIDPNGDAVAEANSDSYKALSSNDSYSTTFDEDDPLNWKVDSDKLDDISDAR